MAPNVPPRGGGTTPRRGAGRSGRGGQHAHISTPSRRVASLISIHPCGPSDQRGGREEGRPCTKSRPDSILPQRPRLHLRAQRQDAGYCKGRLHRQREPRRRAYHGVPHQAPATSSADTRLPKPRRHQARGPTSQATPQLPLPDGPADQPPLAARHPPGQATGARQEPGRAGLCRGAHLTHLQEDNNLPGRRAEADLGPGRHVQDTPGP
jgi:hypothetical protein